jgi:hypothetical protein
VCVYIHCRKGVHGDIVVHNEEVARVRLCAMVNGSASLIVVPLTVISDMKTYVKVSDSELMECWFVDEILKHAAFWYDDVVVK